MPTILLTRPRQDSEQLATRLKGLGYDSLIAPLLTIIPLKNPLPDLDGLSSSMITSRNALTVLEPYRGDIRPLLNQPCFCVGDQTALAAEDFGFQDVQSAASDGTALAEMIHAHRDDPRHLLHIAGRDTQGDARDWLQQNGHQVSVWPVYAAEAATQWDDDLVQAFRHKKIHVVLVLSGRTAATLVGLVRRYGLESFCSDVTLVAISAAVAAQATSLPWRQIRVADKPTEDSLIESLRMGA